MPGPIRPTTAYGDTITEAISETVQEDPRMKALVGSWDRRPYHLVAEITALRTRVRELEEALEEQARDNARLRDELEAARADAVAHPEVALSSS